MAGKLAAQRYAKALLSLSVETDQHDKIASDMRLVYNTIQDSKELRLVLKSPVLKNAQKRDCLGAIFEEVHQDIKRLIDVLFENKRIALLPKVAQVFINLVEQANGITSATLTTALPIDKAVEEKVIEKVKAITDSKKVRLHKKIDKDLIGGFLLRMGDLELDASISGRLDDLKHKFKQSSLV